MPDSSSIGANFSNYQGNPNLGNIGLGTFQIDTRPLANLAAYAFSYNSAQFQQKQKDIVAKAKELADITAYDLNSAITKDRELLQKGYDELYKFVQENPTVLDYQNNPKGWMEYNRKKNEFQNKLDGGKVRSVLYSQRQKEVSNATNPSMKAFLQKSLDDEANATDLATPLKHTQLYDVSPVKVEPPPVIKLDVSNKAGNFIATRKYELPDMASVNAQAQAKSLGFLNTTIDETSPEFLSKTPEEKDFIRNQYKVQSASGKLEPVESSKIITTVLQNPKYQDPSFRNEDGTLNLDLVINDNAGNGIVSGVLSSVKQYNEKMREMSNQIRMGFFNDKLGKEISFGAGGLNENDWKEIDITDGLSTDELLKIRILGLAKPVEYETKITETDDANQSANLAVEWYKAKTGRISANKKEPKDAATIVIDKPAILFGEHIDRVKKYFSAHPNEGNLSIPYEKVDDKTRIAAKLKAGQFIVYKPDGSYVVSTDRKGKTVSSVGTIENLAQGFIDAVKTIDLGAADKDGTMAEGFQIKSEAKFNELFGTTSGKYIWDNWGDTKQNSSQPEATEPEYSREDYKAAGWTDKQIEIALKAGKIKVK